MSQRTVDSIIIHIQPVQPEYRVCNKSLHKTVHHLGYTLGGESYPKFFGLASGVTSAGGGRTAPGDTLRGWHPKEKIFCGQIHK